MNHNLEMIRLIVTHELNGPEEAKQALFKYLFEYAYDTYKEGTEKVLNKITEFSNVGTETDYGFAENN